MSKKLTSADNSIFESIKKLDELGNEYWTPRQMSKICMKNRFYYIAFLFVCFSLASCNLSDTLSIPYYYYQGNSKHQEKDLKGAIEYFSKILEIKNTEVKARISRGSSYLDLKEYQKAIDDYSAALELEPGNALAHAYRGRAYYDSDSVELSLADYNKALEIDQQMVFAYYGRGLLKFTNQDLAGGCKDYKSAADLGDKESAQVVDNYCSDILKD